MDIKDYIENGIIESYVLGLSTPEENREVEGMSVQYPEIKQAILDFEVLFEKQVNDNLIQPPASVKSNLLNILDKDFAVADVPVKSLPQQNIEAATVRKMNYSNYVAAAAVILLIVSTSLNFYFYSNFKKSTDKYEALLTERNTLQANNASYKTELNDMQKSFDIIKSPYVQSIAMNSVKPDEQNHATIYWDKRTKEVYLLANNMNKVPEGKQYQLWAIVDGKPVDAGMVGFDCNGLCKMKVIPNAQAFAVTVEKEGGSPTPTLSTMVVMGKTS